MRSVTGLRAACIALLVRARPQARLCLSGPPRVTLGAQSPPPQTPSHKEISANHDTTADNQGRLRYTCRTRYAMAPVTATDGPREAAPGHGQANGHQGQPGLPGVHRGGMATPGSGPSAVQSSATAGPPPSVVLQKKIGQGGFCAVYLDRHADHRR